MRPWLSGKMNQMAETQMYAQVISKRRQRTTLRADLKHRPISEPLVPRQSGVAPIDNNAIFQILKAATLLERIVQVPGRCPLGMRAALGQETLVSSRTNSDPVDADEPTVEPIFANEGHDLIASVEHWLGLELLVRLEPARASQRLQIQAAVLVANEFDSFRIRHEAARGEQF